jgi:hypothetical protein
LAKRIDKPLTVFKPTKQQLDWLKSALDPTVQPTISAIAKDCGVNRENWYGWIKDEAFMEWWGNVWDEGMKQANWFLDKVGMQMSTKDFRYWEAMQMKFGKFARKSDVTSQGEKVGFAAILQDIDGQSKTLPKSK